MSLVTPHGGKLVNRILERRRSGRHQGSVFAAIANAFSARAIRSGNDRHRRIFPADGIHGKGGFRIGLQKHAAGQRRVWPIPVTLCPGNDQAEKIKVGQKIALKDSQGRLLALMTVRKSISTTRKLKSPMSIDHRRRPPRRGASSASRAISAWPERLTSFIPITSRNSPNIVFRPPKPARHSPPRAGPRWRRSRRVIQSIGRTNISPNAPWR